MNQAHSTCYLFPVQTLTSGFSDLALQVQWPYPWKTQGSHSSLGQKPSGPCLPLHVPFPQTKYRPTPPRTQSTSLSDLKALPSAIGALATWGGGHGLGSPADHRCLNLEDTDHAITNHNTYLV